MTTGIQEDPVSPGGLPSAAMNDAGRITTPLELVRLSQLIRAAFTRAADRHDLTPVQGRLLCVLATCFVR